MRRRCFPFLALDFGILLRACIVRSQVCAWWGGVNDDVTTTITGGGATDTRQSLGGGWKAPSCRAPGWGRRRSRSRSRRLRCLTRGRRRRRQTSHNRYSRCCGRRCRGQRQRRWCPSRLPSWAGAAGLAGAAGRLGSGGCPHELLCDRPTSIASVHLVSNGLS